MQKVAFFDIDGTVFRSNLLVELIDECIERGILPAKIREQYVKEHALWSAREGTHEVYIDMVVTAYLEHIQGVYYGDIADAAREVVRNHGKKVYRYSRDLINDLKGKDYYLVAVSRSPKTIVDEFCTTLGFDKAYGSIYEIGPRDLFTGNVTERALLEDKSRIVERVFATGNFSREGSIGVGDTEGDIPLLESVEIPICFNPNMKLYTYAKAKKWPVVVERKDVVYTL